MQSGGRAVMDGPFPRQLTPEQCSQACLADTQCMVRTPAFRAFNPDELVPLMQTCTPNNSPKNAGQSVWDPCPDIRIKPKSTQEEISAKSGELSVEDTQAEKHICF